MVGGGEGTDSLEGELCDLQQISAVPTTLLQALVPSYGLTTDGECGLTDKAWNLAQGEIYA